MKLRKKSVILIVVLLIIVIGIGLVGHFWWAKINSPEYCLKVDDVDLHCSYAHYRSYISGILINSSKREFSNITIKFIVYDKDKY